MVDSQSEKDSSNDPQQRHFGGRDRFRDWFDHFERSLAHDFKGGGLLEHSTTVGFVREFLVARVLKQILPITVEIGTGRVVDSRGQLSRQIDVILFDSRFPALRSVAGPSLYPVEGVIATLEVKSKLSNADESLENCLSVSSLKLRSSDKAKAAINSRVQERREQRQFTESEAARKVGFEIHPATYVFAADGIVNAETLRNSIEKWWKERNEPRFFGGCCECLPRVLVVGDLVAILDDEHFLLGTSEAITGKLLLVCTRTPYRFGLLASHIMATVAARLAPRHERTGVPYAIDDYVPVDNYAMEMVKERGEFITR